MCYILLLARGRIMPLLAVLLFWSHFILSLLLFTLPCFNSSMISIGEVKSKSTQQYYCNMFQI